MASRHSKKKTIVIGRYGARLKPNLPVTIDSVKAMPYEGERDELEPGCWYIAKPKGAYGPWWLRLYHAWLVMTNKAMAVQFTEDHIKLAKRGWNS